MARLCAGHFFSDEKAKAHVNQVVNEALCNTPSCLTYETKRPIIAQTHFLGVWKTEAEKANEKRNKKDAEKANEKRNKFEAVLIDTLHLEIPPGSGYTQLYTRALGNLSQRSNGR